MSEVDCTTPALVPVLRRAATTPGRPLFGFEGLHADVTTEEFLQLAEQGAATLAALGVGRGDRVAVWAENSVAWLTLLAAAAWRGAALVTVHPALTAPEVTGVLERSRVGRVFVAERIGDRPGAAEAARAVAGLEVDGALSAPEVHVLGDDLGRAALAELPGWGHPAPSPVVDPDAVLNIQFTSGTTGAPKMVGLTSRQLITNAVVTASATAVTGDDRLISPLPLAHAAGLGSGAVLAMVTGASWISMRRFRATTVLDQVAQHRGTVLQMVPTTADLLCDEVDRDPGRWDLSSLRIGFLGGAPCSPALRARVVRTLGLERAAVVYGQTEAGPTISVDPGDGSCRPCGATVGRPVTGTEARVIEPGTDAEAPAGQPGELLVRGVTVIDGYVDDPGATAASFTACRWRRTGDIATLGADGVITLVGRTKELIIRGGENVSPGEVEAALLDDPSIAAACVVGLPSSRWGEEVGALLVAVAGAQPDPERLLATAAERLARHKIPTVLRLVEDLPLLPVGKVDRRAVSRLLHDLRAADAELDGVGSHSGTEGRR